MFLKTRSQFSVLNKPVQNLEMAKILGLALAQPAVSQMVYGSIQ